MSFHYSNLAEILKSKTALHLHLEYSEQIFNGVVIGTNTIISIWAGDNEDGGFNRTLGTNSNLAPTSRLVSRNVTLTLELE